MATSKKAKVFLMVGGIFGLVLLIVIAAWLTGHMMVLSKGVNQLIGPNNPREEGSVATAAVVIKKYIPPEPKPLSDAAVKPTMMPATEAPQVTSVTNTVQESNITEVPESEAPTTTQPTMETTTTTIPEPVAITAESGPKADTTAESSPEPPRPETPTSEPEKPGPDSEFIYEIQVGAFLVETNADERIENLKALGVEPYVFHAADRSHRLWHTIRVGKYETLEEAKEALSRYRARSDYPAVIAHWNSLLPAKVKK